MSSGRRASVLPRAYWRQWWASAVSNLGDGINFAAMPLLAFSLTQDERLLALTTFATMLPWLLLALPIGVAVDRYDRRRLMIVANVVRLVAFSLIAVAAGTGWVSIWSLLAALALIGCCEVIFDSSAQAFIPMLVPVRELPRANGFLFAAEVVAGSLVGLSAGALLFETAPGLPFGINAASFAIAGILIASIHLATAPARSDNGGSRGSLLEGMGEGIRRLTLDPLLRTMAAMLAVANFALMLGQGVFVKYAAVELGVTGARYGLLLMATALGAALGGVTGHRVAARLGTPVGILAPFGLLGAVHFVFWAAPHALVIAAMGFLAGAAITTWNVVTVSLRQELIPSHVFGRVNSVYRWLGTGSSALGALAGGALAYYVDLRLPYLAAAVLTLGALAVLTGPLLRGIAASRSAAQSPTDLTPAPPSIT